MLVGEEDAHELSGVAAQADARGLDDLLGLVAAQQQLSDLMPAADGVGRRGRRKPGSDNRRAPPGRRRGARDAGARGRRHPGRRQRT